MPHKCVRCGNVYEKARLNGCTCGSQLFFFVKYIEEQQIQPSMKIEKEIVKSKPEEAPIETPKIKKTKKSKPTKSYNKNKLKFKDKIETIQIKKKGVYNINVEALLKEKPLIVHEKDKKRFTVDLKSIFKAV